MKKSLIILSLIAMSQVNAMQNDPNGSFFQKLGTAYAAFKAAPANTLGNAAWTVGRYGVYTSTGTFVGGSIGAAIGARMIRRSSNGSVAGWPIATGIVGGCLGACAGLLCAYKHKNISCGLKHFAAKARDDFRKGQNS